MAEIRSVFFDVYGTLLRYGDMKLAWADWLRCPATSAQTSQGPVSAARSPRAALCSAWLPISVKDLGWTICRAMVTLPVSAKPSRQRMVFFMV